MTRLTKHQDWEKIVVFGVWANYSVHIIMTDSVVESFRKRFPSMRHEFNNTEAFHVIHVPNNGHAYLFFPLESLRFGTIAHECWHAIYALLKHVDVDELDNETVAYHLGYLVEQVVEFDGAIKSKLEVTEDESTRGKNGRLQGLHSGAKEKKARASRRALRQRKRLPRVGIKAAIIGGVGRGRKPRP